MPGGSRTPAMLLAIVLPAALFACRCSPMVCAKWAMGCSTT